MYLYPFFAGTDLPTKHWSKYERHWEKVQVGKTLPNLPWQMTDDDNSEQFYETENNYCFQKPSSKSSFFCIAFEINNYISR